MYRTLKLALEPLDQCKLRNIKGKEYSLIFMATKNSLESQFTLVLCQSFTKPTEIKCKRKTD